ncbi:MAG: polyprenyl synthetase family protein [Streptococcaceae bacterium]|jgi:geranylgeranyl diphosphate synthase type II|nr:polyprenyl synthetase family protein [Streptococcaceae bacterium]
MTIDIERLNGEMLGFYETIVPLRLREAVCYSLLAGGKRLRPLFLLHLLEAFGVTVNDAHYQLAATVELIHTGSLIHDDLPAMDDDDYRRGQLTNHKAFDEATAILAGDALFLDPYLLLSELELPADRIVALVRELALASGSRGMVAGQMLDMTSEGKVLTRSELQELHALKTGKMLTFPFVAAGIVAGKADSEIEKLRTVGEMVGLAFQIRDDILDVTADFASLGKTPGKDVLEEKSTYVALLGLEGAKAALSEGLTDAIRRLSELGVKGKVVEMIQGLTL